MNAMRTQSKKKANGSVSRTGAKTALGTKSMSAMRLRLSSDAGGLLALVGVLLALSIMAGLRFERPITIYVAGEIASQDITADEDLLLEEAEATQRKREQVSSAQPPVYDLSHEVVTDLKQRVTAILDQIAQTPTEDLERLRWQISESLNSEISSRSLFMWRTDEFRQALTETILPWLETYFDYGVVGEKRLLLPNRGGIIIRDLGNDQESLKADLQLIRDLGQFRADLEHYLRIDLKKPIRFRRAVEDIIHPMSMPSLTFNREATQSRKREVMEAVEPVYTQIKKGEIIVRQGERVTSDQQLKIQALYTRQKSFFMPMQASGIFIIGFLLLLGLYFSTMEVRTRDLAIRDAVFLGSVFLLFGLMAKVLAVIKTPLAQGIVFANMSPELFPYLLPAAGAMGVLALFFPVIICFFAGLLIAFLCGKLAGGGLELVVFYFISGMFNVFFIKRAQNRIELLSSVFPLMGALLLCWVGVLMLGSPGSAGIWSGTVLVFTCGLLSLLAVLALSPITEHVFGYTSRFKLMELMNLEQPLLQELMVNAPGTYHHSLVVSNMVEAGARAIGANPLLGKVAALYHDIGKLKTPHYFIENQFGCGNKHDKLAPSMSALVLISHAKKGVELAREHKLGPEIEDIIQQHHGTSLITYFYHKAQEQAESRGEEAVREEDYRYPGPKPQTKEAGLILLADVIEASSRTLVDPTPSRLKGHIQKLIRTIFTEGQLDESELTLKDLHLLTDAFLRILTGIFHNRIEYPGEKAESQSSQSGSKPVAPPMYPMHQ
jgi:putative nucleotidyltransferase with HDIG domain